MSRALAAAAAVAAGVGTCVYWAFSRSSSKPTGAHWSQNEPDRTRTVLHTAVALIVAHIVSETVGICARGVGDETLQRTAALQATHVLLNAYALTDVAEVLRLRRGYYDTGKDPPCFWPPVKHALVWRVLVFDTIALAATAFVDAEHGNTVSAAWRAALSSGMGGLLASCPLPFYTT